MNGFRHFFIFARRINLADKTFAPRDIPINKLVNILIRAVVDPTAASDWLPLNLPITIISTALNISCKIPDNINGNENEISLSMIVPLHISISYLLRFIVELIALLKYLFYTVIVQENPFLCKCFDLIY